MTVLERLQVPRGPLGLSPRIAQSGPSTFDRGHRAFVNQQGIQPIRSGAQLPRDGRHFRRDICVFAPAAVQIAQSPQMPRPQLFERLKRVDQREIFGVAFNRFQIDASFGQSLFCCVDPRGMLALLFDQADQLFGVNIELFGVVIRPSQQGREPIDL